MSAIKFKLFYFIEGSEFDENGKVRSLESFLLDVEEWANSGDVDPVEVSHSFNPSPRSLAVFISYIDLIESKRLAKEAAEAAKAKAEEEEAKKKADTKKGSPKKKTPKTAKKTKK